MDCPNCNTPMELVEPGERYSGPPFWLCKSCDHQEDEQICTPCRHGRHQWCWGDPVNCNCKHKENSDG